MATLTGDGDGVGLANRVTQRRSDVWIPRIDSRWCPIKKSRPQDLAGLASKEI